MSLKEINLQVSCWNFLYANIRGGAVIISNPTLEAVTEHLELPFSLSDWVTKVFLPSFHFRNDSHKEEITKTSVVKQNIFSPTLILIL